MNLHRMFITFQLQHPYSQTISPSILVHEIYDGYHNSMLAEEGRIWTLQPYVWCKRMNTPEFYAVSLPCVTARLSSYRPGSGLSDALNQRAAF